MPLFDYHDLDTNLFFLHRGIIEPKSGIGHHFHNQCEEMFVIFDGEAQFTIDGRTSLIKGPAGAPCRMGHSHAIYNPTSKPIQWMNINVSAMKGTYDAFNLGDSRADVALDPIPVFMTMRLDRALLRPVNAMSGGPWAYVDHLALPPNTSTGLHLHREVAEFYYVMNGQGTVTISAQGAGTETAAVRAGDAIPIQLNDVHSFENNSGETLPITSAVPDCATVTVRGLAVDVFTLWRPQDPTDTRKKTTTERKTVRIGMTPYDPL